MLPTTSLKYLAILVLLYWLVNFFLRSIWSSLWIRFLSELCCYYSKSSSSNCKVSWIILSDALGDTRRPICYPAFKFLCSFNSAGFISPDFYSTADMFSSSSVCRPELPLGFSVPFLVLWTAPFSSEVDNSLSML